MSRIFHRKHRLCNFSMGYLMPHGVNEVEDKHGRNMDWLFTGRKSERCYYQW